MKWHCFEKINKTELVVYQTSHLEEMTLLSFCLTVSRGVAPYKRARQGSRIGVGGATAMLHQPWWRD